MSIRDIVLVLHADDLADPPSLGDLRRGHVAQADVSHQSLPLEVGEGSQRRLDRRLGWTSNMLRRLTTSSTSSHRFRRLSCTAWVSSSGDEGREPGSILAASGADLGDDDEIVRIRMQRLTDQLVGDVRSVVIAGVDVVHPGGDGLAQHGQCRVMILGRPEYSWAGRAAWRRSQGASRAHRRVEMRRNVQHWTSKALLTTEGPVALPSAGSTVAQRRPICSDVVTSLRCSTARTAVFELPLGKTCFRSTFEVLENGQTAAVDPLSVKGEGGSRLYRRKRPYS